MNFVAVGHAVVQAESGEAGCLLAVAESPDLILVDYAMPGLLEAGCIGYIPKPFDAANFARTIRDFLSVTVARRRGRLQT